MQTPDTRAGHATEAIMAAWLNRLQQRRLPEPKTAEYNAAYEAVLEVLRKEFREE